MNRRKFAKSALLSGSVLGMRGPLQNISMVPENASSKRQQWYELRTYLFTDDAQRQLTDIYLAQACLPALNRTGIEKAGVFTEFQAQGIARLYLLIPFDSIESFAALPGKLARDDVYQKAGAPYLEAAASSPAYSRIESSLLKAFAHMPQMELPEKKDRLFELRCYESPTESAGQTKIYMFNDAGEIDIFKKIGARPVFFGETLIGLRRPNLTYMLCFEDMNDHDAKWKVFGSDPEWKKISSMPQYSDEKLISKITRTFLSPTAYSQI